MADDKGLGKNISLSEEQREGVLMLVKIGWKSGAIQSEQGGDLLKSIRMAVDFSPAEIEVRKKRAESKKNEAEKASAKPNKK